MQRVGTLDAEKRVQPDSGSRSRRQPSSIVPLPVNSALDAMDISRPLAYLSVSVAVFSAATYMVLSTPSLQWPGVDDVVWPTGFAFLAASLVALLLPAFPPAKRAIACSSHKISLVLSYSVLASYTAICLGALALYPFKLASGI